METNFSVILEAGVGISMSFPATVLAWRMFRGDHFPIALGLVLAFGGFYASFAVGNVIASIVFPNNLALVSAAVVAAAAATDPVAVEAITKKLKGKTTALLESLGLALSVESLFNDPISLREFWVALDQAERAEHSMFLAGVDVFIMLAVTVVVLILTKGNRQASSTVRKIVGTILIFMGVGSHAALITVGVAGNFIPGLVEGWFTKHHHGHEEAFDWIGTMGSYLLALAALPLAIMCAMESLPYFLYGAGFMLVFRLWPTFGVGLLNATMRAGVFGRASAIGVITIAALTFHEVKAYDAAALLAGCAIVSVVLFAPLAIREFTNASKNITSIA